MNKKSQLFNISLVLIAVVVLVNALFVLSEKRSKFEGLFIGSKQFDIIEKYSEGEVALLYIDQSAKYAAEQSVYDLGEESGFYGESECGNYSGLKLWNNFTDYCFPDENEPFRLFLNDNLNEQLAEYPSLEMPLNNYDFLIEDNKITGIAAENIIIDLIEERKSGTLNYLNYSIKPSFTTQFDYNFGIYDTLKLQVLSLLESCSDAEDVMECVNSQIELYNTEDLNWKIGTCGHPAELVYYNLYENFYDCLNAPEDNCYCEFSPQKRIERVEGIHSFGIHFKGRDDNKTNITLIQGQQHPIYKVNFTEVVDLEEPSFIKDFDEGPIITRLPFVYDVEYIRGILIGIKVSWPPIKYKDNIRLYKSGNDLSFVSDEVFDEHRDYFGNKCSQDRTIRFCVTTKERMPVYDIVYDNNELRNIAVQFALLFSDSIAPPVMENVKVSDTLKAENSVTISWDKNKASDVKNYKIYYSDSIVPFEEIDDSVKLIKIVDKDILETAVAGMEPYDNQKEINGYYFAVTAIDYAKNENKSVNAIKGQAIDDLKPNKVSEVRVNTQQFFISWDAVTNEDGSQAVDVRYQVYQSIDNIETIIITLDKDTTSYSFSGPGSYKFGVKAIDETLEGEITWSREITVS